MNKKDMPRSEDIRVLEYLDAYHGDGLSARDVGNMYGVTRNSVIGKINRVHNDDTPCYCTKPENMDSGMSRGWWRA